MSRIDVCRVVHRGIVISDSQFLSPLGDVAVEGDSVQDQSFDAPHCVQRLRVGQQEAEAVAVLGTLLLM
jgi:hypothetical protein